MWTHYSSFTVTAFHTGFHIFLACDTQIVPDLGKKLIVTAPLKKVADKPELAIFKTPSQRKVILEISKWH